ncbi:hypothetical protein Peur_006223 [Populus x canadensis]
MDWGMLSFIRSLKSMLRSANAVAVITFPPSLLSPSFCKRWQHMADVLLSVRAIPGLLLLTSTAFVLFSLVLKLLNRPGIFSSFVMGFDYTSRHAQRITCTDTHQEGPPMDITLRPVWLRHVPVILETTTFSIKLQKRRFLVLECLNQAPIDGSSGTSYGTSGGCSVSSKSGAP